ncbi:MAG TPA: mechanosensitive ion channel [Pseudobdellovibrionaceae bacterium]|nr:mechanosensitive ion channel [Pseudobdellovibrionaceae bacterium]
MNTETINIKLINAAKLSQFLDWEPVLLLGAFIFLTWAFYFTLLRAVSAERHKNIRSNTQKIFKSFIFFLIFFSIYKTLHSLSHQELNHLAPFQSQVLLYMGIICFIFGSVIFVRTFRLFVLQYLFIGSIRHGVPLLIVNIFSLILTLLIFLFALSQFFGVQLGPLLATSAAFSVILGLALQDTLGNLFAGIALQVDKAFEIGDWLEISGSGHPKIIGLVREISWRSTTLIGFTDEIIIVPNRTMSQSQISNFSPPDTPIIKSQIFRLEFSSNIEKAIELLERAASEIHEVCGSPSPLAFVYETTDNGIIIKLVYYINNYGSHYIIGGKVLTRGLSLLKQNGFQPVHQKIQLYNNEEKP